MSIVLLKKQTIVKIFPSRNDMYATSALKLKSDYNDFGFLASRMSLSKGLNIFCPGISLRKQHFRIQ